MTLAQLYYSIYSYYSTTLPSLLSKSYLSEYTKAGVGRKYSRFNPFATCWTGLPLAQLRLLSAAFSRASWARHEAAFNSFLCFLADA